MRCFWRVEGCGTISAVLRGWYNPHSGRISVPQPSRARATKTWSASLAQDVRVSTSRQTVTKHPACCAYLSLFTLDFAVRKERATAMRKYHTNLWTRPRRRVSQECLRFPRMACSRHYLSQVRQEYHQADPECCCSVAESMKRQVHVAWRPRDPAPQVHCWLNVTHGTRLTACHQLWYLRLSFVTCWTKIHKTHKHYWFYLRFYCRGTWRSWI